MRRTAAVVAPLAATALALGLGTGPAGAASRSRTDTFSFTNPAGSSVTCTIESVQDLSDNGVLTVSTTLSGPADCTATRLVIDVDYRRTSDGGGESSTVVGEGRSLSATYTGAAPRVDSSHYITMDTCGCFISYGLSQSK